MTKKTLSNPSNLDRFGLTRKEWRVIALAGLFYIITLIAIIIMAVPAGAVPTKYVAASEATNGGLYLASETPGRLIEAPNQQSIVDINISGPLARVTLTQRFYNPTAEWREAIYVFPLPDKAAVDRLSMQVGERIITGVIQPKEEARRNYDEARAGGRRASMVTQERPNIFSTEVANIGPGETISITIEYQQTLTFDSGEFSIRFPMVVRPRFSPGSALVEHVPSGTGWDVDRDQVSDASRITPPIADPGGPQINPLTLNVLLDAGFPVGEILSSYHPVHMLSAEDGRILISLAEGEVPADRDFELRWRPEAGYAPSAGLFSETIGNYAYHLVMLSPAQMDDATRASLNLPQREVIFILDVSGSMGGTAIEEAKAALLLALDGLGAGDTFNIILFSSEAKAFFDTPQAADDTNLASARDMVRAVVADGGTNMAPAIELALDGIAAHERLRQVIFITDGAVGNEEALFSLINERLGDSRLFTVGISAAPNSFFMTEAAEAGRGAYVYIGNMDEVEAKMTTLFRKLETPLLTDVEISWPDGLMLEGYPVVASDLYDGETISILMRTDKDALGDIEITANAGDELWRRSIRIDTAGASPGVAALWARHKILELTRAARRDYELGGDVLRAAVTEVALSFQLVSQYTSLVAIDDQVARAQNLALGTTIIATNLPSDMPDSFVGGGVALAESASMMTAPQATPAVPAPASIQLRPADRGRVQQVDLPQGATGLYWRLMIGFLALLLSALFLLVSKKVSSRLTL